MLRCLVQSRVEKHDQTATWIFWSSWTRTPGSAYFSMPALGGTSLSYSLALLTL